MRQVANRTAGSPQLLHLSLQLRRLRLPLIPAAAYGTLGDELGQSGTAGLADTSAALTAYRKTSNWTTVPWPSIRLAQALAAAITTPTVALRRPKEPTASEFRETASTAINPAMFTQGPVRTTIIATRAAAISPPQIGPKCLIMAAITSFSIVTMSSNAN